MFITPQLQSFPSVKTHTIHTHPNGFEIVPRSAEQEITWPNTSTSLKSLFLEHHYTPTNQLYLFLTALRMHEWKKDGGNIDERAKYLQPLPNRLALLPKEIRLLILTHLSTGQARAVFHSPRCILGQRDRSIHMLTGRSQEQQFDIKNLNLLPLRATKEWCAQIPVKFPHVQNLKLWLAVNWIPKLPNAMAKRALFNAPSAPITSIYCNDPCVEQLFLSLNPLMQLQELQKLEVWGIPESVTALLENPHRNDIQWTPAGSAFIQTWRQFSQTHSCTLVNPIKADTGERYTSQESKAKYRGYLSPPHFRSATAPTEIDLNNVSEPSEIINICDLSPAERIAVFTEEPKNARLILDFQDISSTEIELLATAVSTTKSPTTEQLPSSIQSLKLIHAEGLTKNFFQAIAQSSIQQLYLAKCSLQSSVDDTTTVNTLTPLLNCSLTTLSIESCAGISTLHYETIGNLYSLEKLYIEQQTIMDSDIESLQYLPKVHTLSLHRSQGFTGQGLQALHHLPIEQLILSETSFEPAALVYFQQFQFLRKLQLDNLDWFGFNYDWSILQQCPRLEVLQAAQTLNCSSNSELVKNIPGLRTGYKLFSNE